jgi:immune inhibitor A
MTPTAAMMVTSARLTVDSTPIPSRAQELTSIPIEAIEVPVRDPLELATRLRWFGRRHAAARYLSIPKVVNATVPTHDAGDQELFWVGNTDTMEQYEITATLRAMTPHLYMWVDDRLEESAGLVVDATALECSAQRFEDETYPTTRALFGSEWKPGVDNDVHLNVLNTHKLGHGVAGYYSSADEFSHLVNPYSNEREMFYINLDVLRPGTDSYDSTLAHEFQHMILWANDPNEDAWVSEGLSTLAEYLNGYGPGTYPESYLGAPDTQLTAWALTGQPTLPHYGASFLFSVYLRERLGEASVRQVVAEERNGAEGLNAILTPLQLSFDEVFADWIVANCLDDTGVARGRYGYEGLDLPLLQYAAQHRTYPVQEKGTVHQYAADYVLLEGKSDLRILFQGASQVRVVPNRPHSGRYQWWSNYGDESDMTLTKAFDLRELTKATLEAWVWFDIEEGWDYAYVEASTDGGESWHVLSGENTTDYNPNGNAFGVGFTGRSGDGQQPAWVKEKIDLAAFVGQEILLRFEYITDDAVNHPGFCVDDIAIPELGYVDDTEFYQVTGEGWEPAGFVRTDNLLEQRFIVQVVELRDPPHVRRMQLDAEQRGEILVRTSSQTRDEASQTESAVLIIGGLAPVTMERATYTYTVTSLPRDN